MSYHNITDILAGSRLEEGTYLDISNARVGLKQWIASYITENFSLFENHWFSIFWYLLFNILQQPLSHCLKTSHS